MSFFTMSFLKIRRKTLGILSVGDPPFAVQMVNVVVEGCNKPEEEEDDSSDEKVFSGYGVPEDPKTLYDVVKFAQ